MKPKLSFLLKVNLQARQITKESRVTKECSSLVDNLNEHVFARAKQPFRLVLTMDESQGAINDVKLSAKEIGFLHKYADPPAVDFVEAMTDISIANRELQSFKLGLRLEPARKGRGT